MCLSKLDKVLQKAKTGEGEIRDPTKKAGRGLPVELVEKIVSYCNRAELLKCCTVSKALYHLVLPLIYRTFDPSIWPDVVRLERQLTRGMGPACFDRKELAVSVISKIRSIDLHFTKSSATFREQQWAQQECIRSLSRILTKIQNLRSFTMHSDALHEDMSAIWKAMRSCSLEELVLSDRWPQANASLYGPQSKLWTLTNLSKLHLTMLWIPTPPPWYLLPGLIKLLQKTTNLTDLKLNLQGYPHEDLSAGQVSCVNFFKCTSLSNLRFLDLENIACKDNKKTFEFLASLNKLEKLRWVSEHVRGEHSLFHGFGRFMLQPAANIPLMLPALKEVDVTELGHLRQLLIHNSPDLARNVLLTCSSGIPESRQPADLSFLRQCSSIKELHLSIYGHTHVEEFRDNTVTCLNSIPASVQRLAIRMPSHLAQLKLTHSSPAKDYLEALRRLSQLECLILPWTAIFYKTEKQVGLHDDELTQSVIDRAKYISRKAAEKISSLKLVFFQGSHHTDVTGDSAWKANFDETDETDRRFVIKVTREAARDKTAWMKKGFLNNGSPVAMSQKAKKDEGDKVDKEEESSISIKERKKDVAPTIKVEVILSSCVCANCWLVETGQSSDSLRRESMEMMLESIMPMMPMIPFPFEIGM